jgi:hypothetical protein
MYGAFLRWGSVCSNLELNELASNGTAARGSPPRCLARYLSNAIAAITAMAIANTISFQ